MLVHELVAVTITDAKSTSLAFLLQNDVHCSSEVHDVVHCSSEVHDVTTEGQC